MTDFDLEASQDFPGLDLELFDAPTHDKLAQLAA